MSEQIRPPLESVDDDEEDVPGWIEPYIRLTSANGVGPELPPALAASAERVSPDTTVVRIPTPAEATLRDLLEEDVLTLWLQHHRDMLAALEDVELDLVLRWSPTVPQEPITVDAELMGLVAALDAGVVFDTYDH